MPMPDEDQYKVRPRDSLYTEAMIYNNGLMICIILLFVSMGYTWEGLPVAMVIALIVWCRATYLYIKVWK
jgi:hypothetical protein